MVFGVFVTAGLYIDCKSYEREHDTIARAYAYFYGVKYGNSKAWSEGWPLEVSDADKAHAKRYSWFVEYD